VFSPKETAVWQNLTCHPESVQVDNKTGEEWITLPGPAALWTKRALRNKDFKILPETLSKGSIEAFLLVVSQKPDLEAYTRIAEGDSKPVLFLNPWISSFSGVLSG
jgi:hypothetical protein